MRTLIVTLLALLGLTLAAVQVIDTVYESDQQVAESPTLISAPGRPCFNQPCTEKQQVEVRDRGLTDRW